jgi:protein involved in polysaccharide export with SLBB domain
MALLGGPLQVRAQTQRAIAEGLRLGPGDIVRLEVFPDRGTLPIERLQSNAPLEYDVDSSGRVLLPVAGLIQVSGRDFAEVLLEVERAFADEFASATVRVIPLIRIAVLGEVRAPGLLPVDPTMTLSDVVAGAGGLTEMADQGDIRIVRGSETIVVTSADDVVESSTPLLSGDRIVVGRRSWASQNTPWLLGAGASVLASLLTALLVR